jgi:hypothetical protein
MKTGGVVVLVLVALAGFPAYAQSVVSAQAGLVHYTEGRVFVADRAVQSRAGQFAQMQDGDVLRTEEGRTEILLNPGTFLRMGENSSIRMISSRIMDTKLELLSGSIVLEVVEPLGANAITLLYRDASISVGKRGIFRLDWDQAVLRVHDGEALVLADGRKVVVRKGSMLLLDGTWAIRKYNSNETDILDRWSARRAEYLALANISAANRLRRGRAWATSDWSWDPYFGMFAFVPFGGRFSSPYGFRYYTPQTVIVVFQQPQPPMSSGAGSMSYNSSLGYSTVQPTSTGNSGAMAVSNSAPTTQSNVSTAPVARDTGSAGGRTR